MSRSAREKIPPARYLAASYYEIWYEGLCRLLVAQGLATEDEMRDGRVRAAPVADVRPLAASEVAARLAAGTPTARPASSAPRFAVGDTVRARAMNPQAHTRLPRYCRGKRGTIVATHGAHVFADVHATGQGEAPQWLYTVSFDARELWGDDTTASSVRVDCWEPYLEQARA
jgi:nitrile hydratase